jgi:uncharacterized protein (DUF169 family)
MESKIAGAIRSKYEPVALILSDERPPGSLQFKEGKWGCLMWLVASAAQGKTAACDAQTFGCAGGGVGFGFGDQYQNFPGGIDCFCRFLSSGNEATAEGRAVAEQVKPFMRPEAYDEFLHGERYLQSPEHVRKFVELLPITEIPTRYVILKPLSAVDRAVDPPEIVVFLVNPNQLSALVVLANYDQDHNENVIVPFAAGCQAIGIYPYQEARSENPRAVMGLVDLSARLQLKKRLGDDLFSFSVPYALFERMEGNVAGSFLERPTWKTLIEDEAAPAAGA